MVGFAWPAMVHGGHRVKPGAWKSSAREAVRLVFSLHDAQAMRLKGHGDMGMQDPLRKRAP